MIHNVVRAFERYPLDFYSQISLLLPVGIALYRQKFLSPGLRSITFYFAYRFLSECLFLYFSLQAKNNHGLIKASLILEVLIIGEFFLLNFTENRLMKRVVLAITLATSGAALLNFLQLGPLSITRVEDRVFLIILSLIYFNKIMTESRVRKIWLHPMFWLSAGFLIYGMGTFMVNLFYDYLLNPLLTSDATYDLFSDMDHCLEIQLALFASAGLWTAKCDKTNYIQFI